MNTSILGGKGIIEKPINSSDINIFFDIEAGLPIKYVSYNGEPSIAFEEKNHLYLLQPDIRRIKDILSVLDEKAKRHLTESELNIPLYYMFRNVHLQDHEKTLIKRGLRYDITVVLPFTFKNGEYVKTLGHSHPTVNNIIKKLQETGLDDIVKNLVREGIVINPLVESLKDKVNHLTETDLSFPEIYEVLHGKAHYLLQKQENGKVTEAKMIVAEKHDRVLLPPNYSHVTINVGNEPLIMANWIANFFSSIYHLDRYNGAVYKLKENGWEPNENYLEIPPLIQQHPNPKGFIPSDSMYSEAYNPQIIDLVVNPARYKGIAEVLANGSVLHNGKIVTEI